MRVRTALLAAPVAVLTLPLAVAPALAHGHGGSGGGHSDGGGNARTYVVKMTELNNSGATGVAVLRLDGTSLHVQVHGRGFTPNLPHVGHLHGEAGDENYRCPTLKQDKNGDGFLTTLEGAAAYGGLAASLTTRGDTSAKSALAVDRAPVADKNGHLRYKRTIPLSAALAKDLDHLHVNFHGLDVNGNGRYDFKGKGKSELDPKLPQEATAPSSCGAINRAGMGKVPRGGVETGTGSTAGLEGAGLLALGGSALVGSAALAYAARRRQEA